jgi:hypothetical protein
MNDASTRPGPRAWRLIVLVTCLLAIAPSGGALAQAPSPHDGSAPSAASVPPLPAGDGRMVVEVVLRDSGAPAPDVDVALYALSPDGQPGLGSGSTGADGRFVFEDISTAPGITYLAGANYQGIPFGERVAFEAGSREQAVRIEVIGASVDGPPISVDESRIQVGWLGPHLLFEVTHLLRNPGDTVRKLDERARETRPALFEASLPREFVEFAEAAVGFADGLERDGTKVRFFGPVYPGQQEIRYRFTLAVPEARDGAVIDVDLPQPRGSGRITVLTPASGPMLRTDAPLEAKSLDLEGIAYDVAELPAVAPGETLHLALEVPPSRSDANAIRVPRADYWLDHDDAVVSVRAQIQLEVSPGPHVQGTPEQPLIHIALPADASLDGVSTATQALGVGLAEGGGIDVIGPVPAGTSSIEFGYQVPARADGSVALDLDIDRPVDVVNVLVADNGIAIDSKRLHRRRPFRQGTRNYLHRRAFQLAADESVDVVLEPLDDQAAPRSQSLLAVLVLGGAAAWFLAAPLRARPRDEDEEATAGPSWQREMIYEAIRDLDHDLDTGKIDEADHAELRSRLRAEAIEIVRREQSGATDASAPSDEGQAAPPAAAGETRPAAFCHHCGGRIEPDWRFCSHCGGGLVKT